MKTNSSSFLRARSGLLIVALSMFALCSGSLRAATIVYDGSNYAGLQTDFDTPQVNVVFQPQYYGWGSGYNDLPNALYAGYQSAFVVDFFALGGSQVTLNSFDLGNWLDAGAPTQYQVYDLSNLITPLVSVSNLNIAYSTVSHPTFNVGLSSSVGLRLSIGPDLYNIGVNNIVFSSSPGPTNVPDGGSLVLVLAVALTGLGVLRRKFCLR